MTVFVALTGRGIINPFAKIWLLVWVCLVLGLPRAAWAFDEFGPQHSPSNFVIPGANGTTLTLMGELEFEVHDIEGEGGPGKDSPTDTKTLGTRSPFVEIDSFWLALRLGLGPRVGLFSVLEFRPDGARVAEAWADYQGQGPGWLQHHVEAGYHTPFVKVDRRTERYPLIGTAFWRESELHLSWEARASLTRRCFLEGGLAVAMMRPLELAGVQESTSLKGTINILGLGPARTFSGNGPVYGGRLRASAFGAFAEAFGFLGQLAAEAGTDVLRSALPNYRYLEGGASPDHGDFHWYGARVGYDGFGVHALLEGIASREALLERFGAYGQLSYELPLPGWQGWLRSVEPLVRLETLRVRDADRVLDNGLALRSTAPINAASWDYDILTLALTTRLYQDLVRLRAEYYFIRERNGVAALGLADKPFRNDEFLLQLELRF
jgi:hypothetical protein